MENPLTQLDDLEFPPIEYGVTEQALKELQAIYADPDASTDEGYEHCKDGVRELTSLRTAVETRRKDLKKPSLDWGRQVDKQAKDLIRRIKEIESPVRAEKERVDEIKQAEAREKAEAEQRRIAKIRAFIDEIKATAAEQGLTDTAADYRDRIDVLNAMEIDEEHYGEFVEEAVTERDAALFKLNAWHQQAVDREAQEAQLAKEREELEERQRKIEEAEARQREEQERIDREKREAREKAEAEERAKLEEQERKNREAEAQERERVAGIQARIDDIRNLPASCEGASSSELSAIVSQTKALVPTEDRFEDFLEIALGAHRDTLNALEVLHNDAVTREEQEKADAEALLPDKEKLRRWLDGIADGARNRPEVSRADSQKILQRFGQDLDKFLARLTTAIDKL